MRSGPKISVVIPAFNEEKYLSACLKSLEKQTFRDFEIIVVDNNSEDKTEEVAKSFGTRVIKEKKQGMAHARERGFKESSGEFIARTDADTVVTANWLETIYLAFTNYPDVVGITGPWLSPTPKIPDKVLSAFSYVFSVRLGKLLSGHPFLMGPNMAVRKSAWQKIKVHTDDRNVHEDIDLSLHLGKKGKILWHPKMKIVFSLRRIEKDPFRGLISYLGEYPLRYIKTLSLNNKRLKELKRKRLKLKKYLTAKVFKRR